MTLKCGLAELIITPPFGSVMPGYLRLRRSTGIKDDLYAKAFVIETEERTVAVLSVDALMVQKTEADEICERIHLATGIPEDHVFISATHTHTGAPTRKGDYTHEEYRTYFINRTADAAIQAYQKRQAARIGIRSGEEKEVSFNRRYRMKDGTVMTNPGYSNPDIIEPVGPIDPELTVLRIDDIQGNPLGVVTNFACHTDTVGGTEYCGDFPGEMSRVIKKVLGADVTSLFLLGACGDINHCNMMGEKAPTSSIHESIGRILAAEALRVREKTKCIESIEMNVRKSVRHFEYNQPTEKELAQARHALLTEPEGSPEHYFADQLLKAHASEIRSATAEIQALRLGDWALVGLPGEVFVKLGLNIKQDSPFASTMIQTLCNGSIYGYVCTSEAYGQGGYEPRIKEFSRIPQGVGELFVSDALALLDDLVKRHP